MASPKFDRTKALRVLLDANLIGDRQAAANHRITERTLRNYRARLEGDPELSRAFRVKAEADEASWGVERAATLALGMRKLRELISNASQEQMRDVVGAIKILGELDVAAGVLGSERGEADPPRTSPAAPSGASGSADSAPVH